MRIDTDPYAGFEYLRVRLFSDESNLSESYSSDFNYFAQEMSEEFTLVWECSSWSADVFSWKPGESDSVCHAKTFTVSVASPEYAIGLLSGARLLAKIGVKIIQMVGISLVSSFESFTSGFA